MSQNEICILLFGPPTFHNYNYGGYIHKSNAQCLEIIERVSQRVSPTSPGEPTASDLDLTWLIFYVTGDKSFPKLIQQASQCATYPQIIRAAAKWSYDSHVDMNVV